VEHTKILTVEKKKHLRVRMRALRAELSLSVRADYSRHLSTLILESSEFEQAGTIALYRALDGEVDPKDIALASNTMGKRVCYPKVTHCEPLAFMTAQRWEKGSYGYEPVGDTVNISEIDLMLVPGVAFTSTGDRLGFGGGHYDRTLSVFSGISIGLSYPFQICETMNTDPWDVRVDRVMVSQAFSTD
jgi:5-formyltetrahydrofolate cyclo-ligase